MIRNGVDINQSRFAVARLKWGEDARHKGTGGVRQGRDD
jgi:hypothetical protein